MTNQAADPRPEAVMTDLIRVEGPCRVYAFDVDNPSYEPVQLQLVRDSDVVLVDIACMPQHAHNDPTLDPIDPLWWRDSWLWQSDDTAIVVPEGAAVVLRAKNTAAITRAYLAYTPPDGSAQVVWVDL